MDVSLSLENERKEVVESGSPKKRFNIRMEGPDGGMAWMVALAACTINFVMAGLARMSGILFVAFISTYGVDRKTASMPSSVKSSTRNLLGPVVGILGQKYGVRKVAVVGGTIATVSAALCFIAPDIKWVIILWGGVGGLGTALTVTLPQVVIGQYFDKHRTTAAGMAFSGGCVGSFLFPKLLEYLLEKYGLQGTLLVLGAIIAHTIPAAMMLRRPPWLDREAKKSVENLPKVVVSSAEESCEMGEEHELAEIIKASPDIDYLQKNGELVAKMLAVKTPVNRCLSVYQNEGRVNHLCVLEEIKDLYRSLQVPQEKTNFQKNIILSKNEKLGDFQKDKSFKVDERIASTPVKMSKTKSVPDISKLSLDMPKDSLSAKLKGLHCMKSPQIVAMFPEENKRQVLKVSRELRKLFLAGNKPKNSLVIPSKMQENTCKEDETLKDSPPKDGFLDHVKTAVSLHFKPLFLLICLCRCIHFITFLPVMATMVDYVKDKGFQAQDGSIAIAALSLGDLIGRLCFGWVTDRSFLKLGKYMLVVMVLQGASTASLPMMTSRIAHFAGLSIFGMLQGSLFVRHPVLVSQYMEPHEQSIAMGCVNFFSGILGFALPTYIGYFRDTLHSYDYIFYINGVLGALTGLLWGMEPYFVRCCKKQQQEPVNTSEDESV